MLVITIDQRRSRRGDDLVEPFLARLNSGYRTVRGFERTAGDEVQGVLDDGAEAVRLALDVAASGEWSTGIGVGAVRLPLPRQTRAGAGPAFEYAREAVERAKSAAGSLAVAGPGAEAGRLEAELQLVASVQRRRTDASAEAGRLIGEGLSQREAAERLGVSQQAVSSRLASGLWYECRALAEAAGRALGEYSTRIDEGE